MFCTNCGAQNDENANFCEKCGAKLVKITYTGQTGQNAQNQQEQNHQQEQNSGWGTAAQNLAYQQKAAKEKKKKTGKWIAVILVLVIILAAVLTAGFFVLKSKKEKKQYAEALENGYKYLEEMDYEKAEDAFLKAVSIAPKEVEPYNALADMYLAQDETEKAAEILEQAAENVPEEEQLVKADSQGTGADSSGKKELAEQDGSKGDAGSGKHKTIAEKLDEIKGLKKYTWVVEPTIEADDIYYLPHDAVITTSRNDMRKQVAVYEAVIRRGDSYSLIGMDGELADEFVYRSVSRFANIYILTRKEAKYESEYKSMWDMYTLQDGEIVPVGGLGSGAPINEYYYYEGIQNFMEMYADSFRTEYKEEPENPVPVQQADKIYTQDNMTNTSYKVMRAGLPYALYADGKLVTDFEYEDMCSWSEGLIGVKKDGKWGYINEKGEVVIPLEYDSSWQHEPVWLWEEGDVENSVYAVSEGYVPLCKNGVWEMRDTAGKMVIMPGVFEQICPVYDGKCWVKRDGKWGVIRFGDTDEKENPDEKEGKNTKESKDKKTGGLISEPVDYEAVYGPILEQLYKEYNIYYKYDIDKDGIDEILVERGTCEADYFYQVYTIEDGESVYLGEIPGGHTAFYADENGGTEDYIYHLIGHMGYETVSKVKIKNGKIVEEEQYQKELGENEEYFQTDYPLDCATLDDHGPLKK